MAACLLKKDSKAMNTNDISQASHTLIPLPEDDETLIRRSDLPKYLPIATQTLARWAVEGHGPRMTKIGRRVVAYKVEHVREWLQGQVRESTIKV
jgi:predicted DNA-binding transcriptional regulator AlpA